MSKKDVGNKIPIYKLKTTDEVMEFYDDWGDKDKYNKDMVDWAYTGPKETVNTFKKYTKNKDILINDIDLSAVVMERGTEKDKSVAGFKSIKSSMIVE